MGQRDNFSENDVGKLNRMYGCNRKPWLGFGLTGNEPTFSGAPIYSSTQRPSSNFGSSSNAAIAFPTNNVGGREDRNPFREIFKAYTSPQFWQRLFGAWLFPQPQPRHQQQTYSDSAYTNYPYFFNQGYYG